jgi:hypothetical protein
VARPLRVAATTAALLPEFFPASPLRPLQWASAPPGRDILRYAYAGGTQEGDLYLPAGGVKRGAVILALGVHPLPRDDPLVVQVASGLARAGLVTLVPFDADLDAGRILPREIDALVAAFGTLAERPEVDGRRIGYLGFSIGAGLALVAAADPRIRDRVAFVNAFGGYFDARDLFLAIASGTIDDEVVVHPWKPAPLAVLTFREQLIETVPDDQERAVLRAMLVTGDAQPPDVADRFSPEARRVLDLTSSPSRADAARLWDELPEQARADWRRLSPRYAVADLRASIFIMHDLADAYVPYTESRRLTAALPPTLPRRYTEFSIFRHVVPARLSDPLAVVGDSLRLYSQTLEIMQKVM